MNGYKGDHTFELSCESDSDLSEVSNMLQVQASAGTPRYRRSVRMKARVSIPSD